MCGGIWLHPSKDLQRLIIELDNCSSSNSALAVKEGYGELFRIRRKDQMEENDTKLFDWTSSSIIVSAPIGTYYSIEGAIIHAGTGAVNGEVRVMLFWTWNELGAEEYGRDKQETKLTLIISVIGRLYKVLGLGSKGTIFNGGKLVLLKLGVKLC